MRRLSADTWIAFVLLAASAVFLVELSSTEATGAYIKTTTLPIALAVLLAVLALALLVWSLSRPAAPSFSSAPDAPDQARPPDSESRNAAVRVIAMVVWTAVYIVALPWFGYLASSAAYIGGLNLLYGNWRPVSVVLSMVLIPLVLLLFFEKFMVVLLPSPRLFS